ncbi:MAG TPA: GAF domain-containing protein [Rubrivivax sp.]|nr:GAF domain-containing protein [Rubrivivax sp.]
MSAIEPATSPQRSAATDAVDAAPAVPRQTHDTHRGKLFRKYLRLILSLVSLALLASGGISLYFSWRETTAALASLQREKAIGAAARIEQYLRQVTMQLQYAALPQMGAGDLELRRIEFLKLLRQAPEVTDIALIDSQGRELIAESRLGMSVLASGKDRSAEPAFQQATRGQPWFGPVYFRKETEPYMTVAFRSGGDKPLLTVAELNLKFIWDVVSRIRIGDKGKAYVVDQDGFLVADPDIGLVLRKTQLGALAHVKALTAASADDLPAMPSHDLGGARVLASMAPIEPLGWRVFVEQPVSEVYARLNATILWTAGLLLAGLAASALAAGALARSMVRPIRTLDEGARRIGAGDLEQQIVVRTGDELEGLAEQFNRMSAQLRESYAGLERKVEDRTAELREALDYQTAISEVLRVISLSSTDVTPVFQAIVESARRLLGTSTAAVFRYDGQQVHLVATHGWSEEALADARRHYPGPPTRRMISGRTILSGQVQAIHDASVDTEYDAQTSTVGAWRRLIAAPMLKDGQAVGVIAASWPEPGETPPRQVELLKTFADQAVIAIENARLITETREALEHQTATGEVLQVISGSMADATPVFGKILDACERLFGATDLGVFLVGADERLHAGASRGGFSDWVPQTYPRALAGTMSERVMRHGRLMHWNDLSAADDVPGYIAEVVRARGNFSVAVAPLLWQGRGIGTIDVMRRPPRPWSAKELALIDTFADQTVIAIQNARLFNETKEALEQQTATAEILSVISSSTTDVKPVFEAILESAGRLLGSPLTVIYRYDGRQLHIEATRNWPDEALAMIHAIYPAPPDPRTIGGRVVLSGEMVTIEDAQSDPSYHQELARCGHWRRVLGVPMLRDGVPIGVIALSWPDAGPTLRKQRELIQTFAGQAVIAIENVRLFNETKEALEQQTATAEVLQVISSSVSNEQPVFEKILESCERLFGSARMSIFIIGDDAKLHLGAYRGPDADVLGGLYPVPLGNTWTEAAIHARRVLHFPDVLAAADAPPAVRQVAERIGHSFSQIQAPMLWEGRGVGSLLVTRDAVGPFSDKEVELLKTFAGQAVIAIQNARLFNEIQDKSRQLGIANQHKSEFLANMSHELRTPLNAIIGFSEVLIERMFGELNDKQDDYLKDIHSSGRHLLSLINDILDLSKIEAGRMELDVDSFDVPAAIGNALTLVRERALRHGIALQLQVAPAVGEIRADERKFKQILLNLLTNAVKFTPDGGRVDVRARFAGGVLQVAVADTGIGIAPEDQAAVFEEFRQVGRHYTNKQEGTGLGLALTKRFVELHGGTLTLDSTPGRGSTFSFTLPSQP